MKATRLFQFIICGMIAGVMCNCANNPALKINTPAVQAQVIGDVEKDLLAGGGALLISGGNTGAAVAALTAQEVQNLPGLQKVLDAGTPATVTAPVTGSAPNALLPAVKAPGSP